MRARRKTSGSSAAGFTLTELLIVLLLIAIFSAVMLAEMRGTFQDALLRSSAREIMNSLSGASSRAITLNQAHSFTFDHAQNAFAVRPKEVGEKSEEEPMTETRSIDERITIEIRDPAEIPEESTEEEAGPADDTKLERDIILFYPDGTADRREVVLRDIDNAELVLRINPTTARVRVADAE